uniref:Dysbindin domain-containing protein 1 n=1 Tax=Crocodylus porosus TaxID=8502 RepID=A0A7M4EL74_CROPO
MRQDWLLPQAGAGLAVTSGAPFQPCLPVLSLSSRDPGSPASSRAPHQVTGLWLLPAPRADSPPAPPCPSHSAPASSAARPPPPGRAAGALPGAGSAAAPLQPLSSVSSLEVHFDLLDLTELTDMSDQELAEVFADSDDENVAESPGGLQPHALPRAGYLRSPSWTRGKAEQGRDRTRLGDSELQAGEADTFLTVERPQDE